MMVAVAKASPPSPPCVRKLVSDSNHGTPGKKDKLSSEELTPSKIAAHAPKSSNEEVAKSSSAKSLEDEMSKHVVARRAYVKISRPMSAESRLLRETHDQLPGCSLFLPRRLEEVVDLEHMPRYANLRCPGCGDDDGYCPILVTYMELQEKNVSNYIHFRDKDDDCDDDSEVGFVEQRRDMVDMEKLVKSDWGEPDYYVCEGCKSEWGYFAERCPCCQGCMWAQYETLPDIIWPKQKKASSDTQAPDVTDDAADVIQEK